MANKYAILFRLPFEKKHLCVYSSADTAIAREGHQFSTTDNVICLNIDDYLNSVDDIDFNPSTIFDVNVAVRMLTGFPAANYSNDCAPWKGVSCLGKHLSGTSIFPKIKSIENGNVGSYSEWISSLPEGWEHLLINALKLEHARLEKELISRGLLGQFLGVEMPLFKYFANVGLKGIKVDHNLLYKKYQSLDVEYYNAVKCLELVHGYTVKQRVKNLCYEDIQAYAANTNKEDFSKKYFWESVEYVSETSDFMRYLLVEHRNRLDLNEMLRINSAISGRCRMYYDIYGTVSGRILVSRPGIQQLKRTSRDMFSPEDGNIFIYADYSQYEPGILASISKDKILIKLYNDGDVYAGLALNIGLGSTRKAAKEIFLSYIYGMSKESIKRRVSSKYSEPAGETIGTFFNQFNRLEEWRANVVSEAKSNKYVVGPYKYLRKVAPDDSDRDLERWAPNHIIQSTASGIFKDSLIKLSGNLSSCRLLVPMHDAILIECPSDSKRDVMQYVETIMKESFTNVCPEIVPKISFEPFSSL